MDAKIVHPDVSHVPVEHVLPIARAVCKVMRSTDQVASGFLVTIPVDDGQDLCGLLTNQDIISMDDLAKQITITLSFEFLGKVATFSLMDIRYSTASKNLDISFIELPAKVIDELGGDARFLQYSAKAVSSGVDVFIVHYPAGGKEKVGPGVIQKLIESDIRGLLDRHVTYSVNTKTRLKEKHVTYNINTEAGSRGSPVVDKDGQVIAVHKGNPTYINANIATYIQWIKTNYQAFCAEPATRFLEKEVAPVSQ